MAKASKQIIIDSIVSEIEKGTTRAKVVAKFCKKFQKSARTIDSYWKIANQQHKELQDKAKEAADKVYIDSMADAAKAAVMSKAERLSVLTQIARGEIPLQKPMVVGKEIQLINVVPDWMDRRNAIAEINKMEGDYAETSIKLKGDKENPLFDLSKLPVKFK